MDREDCGDETLSVALQRFVQITTGGDEGAGMILLLNVVNVVNTCARVLPYKRFGHHITAA